MYLSWCSNNSDGDNDYYLEDDDLDDGFCKVSSQICEMVIIPNNHTTFDGPVTGQVIYLFQPRAVEGGCIYYWIRNWPQN